MPVKDEQSCVKPHICSTQAEFCIVVIFVKKDIWIRLQDNLSRFYLGFFFFNYFCYGN